MRWIGLAALAIIVTLTACRKDEVEQIWVSIDPIQCLGNPWEQDWLLTHEYDEYPMDQDDRLRIFREFFEEQGVKIHKTEVTFPYSVICDGCACARGDRIHCLIDEASLPAMLEWGFVEGGSG